jgi:hypothetical protein
MVRFRFKRLSGLTSTRLGLASSSSCLASSLSCLASSRPGLASGRLVWLQAWAWLQAVWFGLKLVRFGFKPGFGFFKPSNSASSWSGLASSRWFGFKPVKTIGLQIDIGSEPAGGGSHEKGANAIAGHAEGAHVTMIIQCVPGLCPSAMFQPCKDDAVDDGNAQSAAIRRRARPTGQIVQSHPLLPSPGSIRAINKCRAFTVL